MLPCLDVNRARRPPRSWIALCAALSCATLLACGESPGLVVSLPPDMTVLGPPDLIVSCPSVFPQFDRRCRKITDCYVADHVLDCCGSLYRGAIATWQKDTFDTAEAVCRSQYPTCPPCAPQPAKADDGAQVLPGRSLGYDCISNRCTSFVR